MDSKVFVLPQRILKILVATFSEVELDVKYEMYSNPIDMEYQLCFCYKKIDNNIFIKIKIFRDYWKYSYRVFVILLLQLLIIFMK